MKRVFNGLVRAACCQGLGGWDSNSKAPCYCLEIFLQILRGSHGAFFCPTDISMQFPLKPG